MSMKDIFDEIVKIQPTAYHGIDEHGNVSYYAATQGDRVFSAAMSVALPVFGLTLAFLPGMFDWANDLVSNTNWGELLDRIEHWDDRTRHNIGLGDGILYLLWSTIAFMSAFWTQRYLVSPSGIGATGGGSLGFALIIGSPLSYFGGLMGALPEILIVWGFPLWIVKAIAGLIFGPLVIWCEFWALIFGWLFG